MSFRDLFTEAVFFKYAVNIVYGQSAVNLIINSKHRRQAASAYTAAGGKRKSAVLGAFVRADSESFAQLVENISRAFNIARGAAAALFFVKVNRMFISVQLSTCRKYFFIA